MEQSCSTKYRILSHCLRNKWLQQQNVSWDRTQFLFIRKVYRQWQAKQKQGSRKIQTIGQLSNSSYMRSTQHILLKMGTWYSKKKLELFGIESNCRIIRKQLFGMHVVGKSCGVIWDYGLAFYWNNRVILRTTSVGRYQDLDLNLGPKKQATRVTPAQSRPFSKEACQ